MTTCVRVFAVDSCGECFDRADKELAVFLSRLLQVADEALDLVRHEVERAAEIAQFSSASYFDSLGKVARSNAMRTAGEFLDRMSQFFREEDTDQERQQSGDETDPECLPAH